MPLASSMRLAAALLCLAGLTAESRAQGAPAQPIWTVPEIGALPDNARGRQIRRGRDLITATYAHVGPNVPDRAKRFAIVLSALLVFAGRATAPTRRSSCNPG